MKTLRWLLCLVVAATLFASQATHPKKAAASSTASPAANKALLDINSAGESDLETLNGIGPALAQKIIAGRPYHGKNELVTKKIIPQSTYNKIKDQIVARQGK